ncbi:MAG: hypothetical protein R6U68_15685, partial [Desulfobacteraceae bacterium]
SGTLRTKGDQTFSLPGVKKIKLFEDQWPQFLIFSLAGKKSSVVLVPDRQPLGAAVFKKLDNRVSISEINKSIQKMQTEDTVRQ